jgi:succinylglutamate desuccinylase
MQADILTELPDGFLDAAPSGLHQILNGPTLIHLPGRRAEPLFVSILLHGNEDTGLKAMQRILANYRQQTLPRSLSLFVGNVQAARLGLRHLEGQPDYNRVWPGCEPQGLPEEQMMEQIVEDMRTRRVFASIDIHNNTGLNPHYACIDRLEQRHYRLATLFSRIVVHFARPLGVQGMAFAELCPAVTVECGKAGDNAADDHAASFVEAALHLDHFPQHPVARHDMDLYRAVAIVKVPDHISLGFGAAKADIVFHEDLDHLNFCELPPGTSLGEVAPGQAMPLQAWDDEGRDVATDHFALIDGKLQTRHRLMPAMLTRDAVVIRQDCLCYLMQPLAYRPPKALGQES